MKRISLAFVMMVSLMSPSVLAQQPVDAERLAAARAYLAATQNDARNNQIIQASIKPLLAQIKAKQPAIYAEKEAKVTAIVTEVMSASIKTAQTGLDESMAKIFTANEIKALQLFSESPLGSRVLQKMPQFTAVLLPAVQKAMVDSIPLLITRLDAEGVKLQ